MNNKQTGPMLSRQGPLHTAQTCLEDTPRKVYPCNPRSVVKLQHPPRRRRAPARQGPRARVPRRPRGWPLRAPGSSSGGSNESGSRPRCRGSGVKLGLGRARLARKQPPPRLAPPPAPRQQEPAAVCPATAAKRPLSAPSHTPFVHRLSASLVRPGALGRLGSGSDSAADLVVK